MADTDSKFQKAVSILKKGGLKITVPRQTILRRLALAGTPLAIEELHTLAGASRCDLATVYRTVEALEKMGLVRRCDFGDGSCRYELSIPDERHHHYIRCRVCKKIEPVEYCGVENVEPAIEQVLGYDHVSHSLVFFGICPGCRKSDAPTKT